MEPSRRAWLAPQLIAIAVLGGLAGPRPDPTGAAGPAWDPPPCPDDPRDAPPVAGAGPAWFRLHGVLSPEGTLVGQRLSLGLGGDADVRVIALPSESFATGPVGGAVLVGADDARSSRLRLIDVARGCATDIAASRDVLRSALLDPADGSVVEHRVDRTARTDLGVWRRPADGGRARRVLGPLEPDPAYGPTFSTELAVGRDGLVAAVSCGERQCRGRVLDGASGAMIAVPDIGPHVGLAAGTLVAHRPCPGLPCPIEAIELSTQERRVLVASAGLAVVSGPAADRVVHETGVGPAVELHVIDLGTGAARRLERIPDGLRLLPASTRSGAGVGVGDGEVVLAPDGRPGSGGPQTRLLDSSTGISAELLEVTP